MSNALVTLQQARDHCRIDVDGDDSSPHDPMLSIYIEAASEAVLNYIKPAPFLNSDGDVDRDIDESPLGVPFQVQAAVLLLVGEFFKNREAEQGGAVDAQSGYAYLPRPVVALLYPFRLPVIA